MTYRLTDDDRETLEQTFAHAPEPVPAGWIITRKEWRNLFAAVEEIIAPIHARAEEAEAAGAEVARQMFLQVEAHRARAEAAEKRADDLAAVIDRVRALLGEWQDEAISLYANPGSGRDIDKAQAVADCAEELRVLLPDDTKDREGVGTGAGGGATGQDTGTAWDTRSTGCPEDRAQAHLLASPDGTKEADQ